jgi:hypothetical protein
MDSRVDASCALGEPAIGAGMGASNVLPLGTTPTSDTFVVESVKPNVGFLKRGIQPPSSVYVETTDVLVVGCATSQTGELLTVNYRLLRFDGIVIHGQFTIQPTNNRLPSIHQEQLAEGFLMSVSCKATVATTRGMTFVRAFLTKPSLGAGQPSYMLMADYVTTNMAPAHPNGRILTPVEGPGNLFLINSGSPPAGAEFTINVPVNARWRLNTVAANLATDAVVPVRTPRLVVFSGAHGPFIGGGTFGQPGSGFFTYSWSSGLPFIYDNVNTVIEPLPVDFILPSGMTIQSNTHNLDVADQWSVASFLVEEWLDNV